MAVPGHGGAGSSLRTPQPQTWLCRLHPNTAAATPEPSELLLLGSASPQLWFLCPQPSPSSVCRRCGHPRYKTSFSGLLVPVQSSRRGCRLSSSQNSPSKASAPMRQLRLRDSPRRSRREQGRDRGEGRKFLPRSCRAGGELYLALGYQPEPWSLSYVVGAAGWGLPGARGTVFSPLPGTPGHGLAPVGPAVCEDGNVPGWLVPWWLVPCHGEQLVKGGSPPGWKMKLLQIPFDSGPRELHLGDRHLQVTT